MKKIFIFLFGCIPVINAFSQGVNIFPAATSVPRPYSAFNDIAGWWRADTHTGSSGGYSLTDLSANANNMVQQAGTLTFASGVNSQQKMTGNSSAYLNSTLGVKSWPCTIITIAVRANNALVGFVGHTGASPANTLWYGYEASNVNTVYNLGSSTNTTSEAGSIASYGVRMGYGSRMTLVNGIIQNTMTQATIAQTSALPISIGTQYRGLNCDWYETLVWNRNLSYADYDEVYTYLNSRYAMSLPLWSSYTAIPIVVMWGQSNMAGRAVKAGLSPPYSTAQTGVNIWYGGSGSTTTLAYQFSQLDESAFNNSLGDDGVTYFGMEATLGYRYRQNTSNTTFLFKTSKGNTFLNQQGGSNYWMPNNTGTPGNGNNLYSNLLMQNWFNLLRYCQTNSLRPDVRAIVGFQGENDATTSTDASAYQQNNIDFYSILRFELGSYAGTTIFPKVIICRLPSWQAGESFLSTVRTAQVNTASILSNATYIDTDSYTSTGDNVHLDGTSLQSLGNSIADITP